MSVAGRIASAPAVRCRLDNTPGTAPGSHNAANIHLHVTTEVRFGGRRYRDYLESASASVAPEHLPGAWRLGSDEVPAGRRTHCYGSGGL